MATFANAAAFNDPQSRMKAQGVDVNVKHAIVDPSGQVLAYAQTGGMIGPVRHELLEGTKLFRFGAASAQPRQVASGAWWVEKASFEKLVAFAQAHELAVGMAARIICLVPPEWSDLGLLVRARVVRPLLAFRGLGNSVVTPIAGGLGTVRLPHQNEIAARRLHQLFIPGLWDAGLAQSALSIEQTWPMDVRAGMQGWVYV